MRIVDAADTRTLERLVARRGDDDRAFERRVRAIVDRVAAVAVAVEELGDPVGQGVYRVDDELDLVGFEPHSRAAAVAETTPCKFTGEIVEHEGESGRQPLDRHDERRSVGFTRCQIPQHALRLRNRSGRPRPDTHLSVCSP